VGRAFDILSIKCKGPSDVCREAARVARAVIEGVPLKTGAKSFVVFDFSRAVNILLNADFGVRRDDGERVVIFYFNLDNLIVIPVAYSVDRGVVFDFDVPVRLDRFNKLLMYRKEVQVN
jgi:hypothetical protein